MNVTEIKNVYNKYVLAEYLNPFIIFLYATGYILQFIFCVVGNSLELYILPRIKQPNDYITYALCTLACIDLLIAFNTMPLNFLRTVFDDWLFGEIGCKLLVYVNSVIYIIGIWITVYISFDRYIIICHPLRLFFLKNKHFVKLVLAIIVFGYLTMLFYIFHKAALIYDNKCKCSKCRLDLSVLEGRIHLYYYITIQYLLPVTFLIFFNLSVLKVLLNVHYTFKTFLKNMKHDELASLSQSQSNDLVVKLSICFLFFFIITNFPLFASIIYASFNSKDYSQTLSFIIFFDIAKIMRTMNSSLNPWMISIYSIKYRKELQQIFSFSFKKPKEQIENKIFEEQKTLIFNYNTETEEITQ